MNMATQSVLNILATTARREAGKVTAVRLFSGAVQPRSMNPATFFYPECLGSRPAAPSESSPTQNSSGKLLAVRGRVSSLAICTGGPGPTAATEQGLQV